MLNIKEIVEIARKKYKNKTVESFQGHLLKVTGEIKYNPKYKTISCSSACLASIDKEEVKWVKIVE